MTLASNNLSLSVRKDMNLSFSFLSLSPSLFLTFLTYTLILGKIQTNGLIISSKYLIKKLFFVSITFEILYYKHKHLPPSPPKKKKN